MFDIQVNYPVYIYRMRLCRRIKKVYVIISVFSLLGRKFFTPSSYMWTILEISEWDIPIWIFPFCKFRSTFFHYDVQLCKSSNHPLWFGPILYYQDINPWYFSPAAIDLTRELYWLYELKYEWLIMKIYFPFKLYRKWCYLT